MKPNNIQRINDHYSAQISKLHGLKDILVTYVDLPEEEIRENHDQISDFLLATSILSLDIAICCKHLLLNREANDEYEMNYFSRALATHSCDALEEPTNNTKSRILNKLSNIIQVYINDDNPDLRELSQKLIEQRLKITVIREQHVDDLKFIRNNLFAHRDKTGIEQEMAIKKLDPQELGVIGEDIYNTLFDIMGDALKIQEIIAPL